MTPAEQSKCRLISVILNVYRPRREGNPPKVEVMKGKWDLTPAADEQGLARQMDTINDDGSDTRQQGQEKKGIKRSSKSGTCTSERKGSTL